MRPLQVQSFWMTSQVEDESVKARGVSVGGPPDRLIRREVDPGDSRAQPGEVGGRLTAPQQTSRTSSSDTEDPRTLRSFSGGIDGPQSTSPSNSVRWLAWYSRLLAFQLSGSPAYARTPGPRDREGDRCFSLDLGLRGGPSTASGELCAHRNLRIQEPRDRTILFRAFCRGLELSRVRAWV